MKAIKSLALLFVAATIALSASAQTATGSKQGGKAPAKTETKGKPATGAKGATGSKASTGAKAATGSKSATGSKTTKPEPKK